MLDSHVRVIKPLGNLAGLSVVINAGHKRNHRVHGFGWGHVVSRYPCADRRISTHIHWSVHSFIKSGVVVAFNHLSRGQRREETSKTEVKRGVSLIEFGVWVGEYVGHFRHDNIEPDVLLNRRVEETGVIEALIDVKNSDIRV